MVDVLLRLKQYLIISFLSSDLISPIIIYNVLLTPVSNKKEIVSFEVENGTTKVRILL